MGLGKAIATGEKENQSKKQKYQMPETSTVRTVREKNQ